MDSHFELKIMSETDPGNNLPFQAVLDYFLVDHFLTNYFWLFCAVKKPSLHDHSLCFLRAVCLKRIHHFPLHYKTLSLSFARIFGPWFREQT